MIDLLTIGDIDVDIFLRVIEAETRNGKISFKYGEKIPVEEFKMTVAGNSANVASGGAKLGLKTAIYTEVGDDLNAEFAKKELDKRGIDTTHFYKNKKAVTDVHPIVVYKGERTIFSHHTNRTYKMRKWDTPKIIYYTSMSEGFEGFQKELLEYLDGHPEIIFSINPGSRMLHTNIDAVREVFNRLDILFTNKEEAQEIAETKSGDVEALHKKLHKMGAKLTVITDSVRGSSAFDGKKMNKLGIFEGVEKVDATGAGDAFASGFISAVFYNKPVLEAMKWGTINSAGEISKVGTGEGLRTYDEMVNLAEMAEFSEVSK